MQALIRRRHVLLVAIVGFLAVVALCCAGLELLGVPVLEPFGLDELFTRHEPAPPPGIVVEEGGGEGADQDSRPAPPVPAPTRSENDGAPPATPPPR